MDRVNVFIPLIRGLNEAIDERVRPADGPNAALSALTNGYYPRSGGAAKRNGFVAGENRLAGSENTIAEHGDCRLIFSTDEELCVLGPRRLYALNEQQNRWYNKGAVSPCVGQMRGVFAGGYTYNGGDGYEKDGYRVFVSQNARFLPQPASVFEWGLRFRGSSVDGQETFDEFEIESAGTYATRPRAPRVLGCQGKIVILYCVGGEAAVSSVSTLRRYQYVISTPHVAPTLVDDITTSLHYDDSLTPGDDLDNIRTYDAVELVSGAYAVAYIHDVSRNIEVRVFDSAHSQTATLSLSAADYLRVALATNSSGDLYILAHDETNARVEVWKRDSSLGAVWGPINLNGTSVPVDNLGLAEGANYDGEVRVGCVWWRASQGQPDNAEEALFSRSVRASSGGDLDNLSTAYNLVPVARPFWKGGKCYCAAMYWIGTDSANNIYPFGYSGLYDLDFGDSQARSGSGAGGDPRRPVIAALYDSGVSLIAEQSGVHQGSLAQVWQNGESFFHCVQAMGEYILNTSEVAKLNVNLVEYDFVTVPTADKVTRGSAVIGGGYVSYYSGDEVFELGFPAVPISDGTANGASGIIPAGDYLLTAHWEYPDTRGVVHRGSPAPADPHTLASANSITLSVFTYPGTHRETHRINAAQFRADTSGTFLRSTRPTTLNKNLFESPQVTIIDDYTSMGIPIYITDGVLAAVSPDGARIAKTAIGRVWLGGFFWRDRVQPSSSITPFDATSHVIAPEYSPALLRIISNGSKVMGMEEMDDKLAVLTEDALYLLTGQGPDATGAGDFSQLQLVAAKSGCKTPHGVVKFPGGIIYRGDAGFYQLTRNGEVRFVGDMVRDTTDAYQEVTSAVLVEDKLQARFTCLNADRTDCVVLVYDYRIDAWSTWRPLDAGGAPIVAVSACMHKGTYRLLEANGAVWEESKTAFRDAGVTYVPMDIELSWIQKGGQSGWMHVDQVVPLLARKDPFDLTIEVYEEFDRTTPIGSHTWEAEEFADLPDKRIPLEMPVKQPECSAIKARIFDSEATETISGEGYTCAGFSVELGLEKGQARVPKQART